MESWNVYCLECGVKLTLWFHTDALVPYYHHAPNKCKYSGMKIMANNAETQDEPCVGHFGGHHGTRQTARPAPGR